MNYQFFGTAGICSGVLLVAVVVFGMLYFAGMDEWYYKTTDLMAKLAGICFLLVVAFWLVVGVLCGLDTIWGWGLVR